MDAERFDSLARTFSTSGSRRAALGVLLGGALALVVLTETTVGGKRRRRHHLR